MSPICSFLLMLFVAPQANGQGFLRANNATNDASKVAKAADPPAADNLETNGNDVLINDGSVMLSRGAESQTKDGGDASAAVDNSDGADADIRNALRSEADGLREDLNEDEQDDSGKDADQLQNEVNDLQDELVHRNKETQSIESDESSGEGDADGGADDDEPDVLDANSDEGEDDTQSGDADDSRANGQDDITQDAALLQKEVKTLIEKGIIPKHEDPEVITVLLQTLRKHARIFGNADGEDSEIDDGDEAYDEGSEDSQEEPSDMEESEDESSEDADYQMEDGADDESDLGLMQMTEDGSGEVDEDDDEGHKIEKEVDGLEDTGAQDAAAAATQGGEDEEAATEADERLQDESESLVASEAR